MRSILVLALLATPTLADTFTHTPVGPAPITATERTKPAARHDDPAVPQLSANDYMLVEEVLGEVHADQIAILKELLAKTPPADVADRAELLFRIGEMYAKQYRLHHLRAMQAQIAKIDATAQTEAAKGALVEAVRAYRELTNDPSLRGYAKLDTALFYYAFTLERGGYLAEARNVFKQLLVDYPRSKYVPEAHLAFGEAAFEAGQLADAETHYRDVLGFKASSVYGYARYKLGWVQLNQGKAQDALETFYAVAQLSRADPRSQLFRAAKHDFVRAYAEVGRADKAAPAFARVDRAGAFDMLAQLGGLYLAQGKNDKAIYVYRELLHERPASPLACVWESNVARAMLTAGSPQDRVHEIEELVRLYSAVKTKLPKAELAECRAEAAEMSGQLARMFHGEAVKTRSAELAGFAARLYRAYLGAFADAADHGDTEYFAAELAWSRAELEPTPQHWEDAARAFGAVTDSTRVAPKLVQVAADAAMLAWMKALGVDPHAHAGPVADAAYDAKATPKPIPEREQKLLAAFDGYLTHVTDPKDGERVDVQFLKANLLRRYDHFADAIPIFLDILAHHRAHDAAEVSAQFLLDSYNRLQRYDELLGFADQLIHDPWLAQHDALKVVVEKVHRQGIRKGAERLHARAQATHELSLFIACATQYLGAYNAQPDAPESDELLFSAGVCYEEGKSMGAAQAVYQTLGKLYPKSKLTARSIARLGNVYAQTAFYREAAEKLEEYAAKFAGEHDAYDALSEAVGYRKGLGDDAQAIADTRMFIRMFGAKRPVEAANASWSLTAIYEKQGDDAAVINHLRGYLAAYGKADAERTVTAYAKLGQTLWQKACPVKGVDGSCVRIERETALRTPLHHIDARQCGDDTKVKLTVVPRDPVLVQQAMTAFASAIGVDQEGGPGARYYFALSKLGQAERDYEHYLRMPLPANLDFDPRKPAIAAQSHKRFEAWFVQKRAVAVKLKERYEAIVKLGDGATAIASASRLGQVLESFSGQLFRAEIPANLRLGPFHEETTQAYCDGVTQAADVLETEAKTAFQLCLETSKRLGWFSEASRVCERELGQLDPQTWPTASEVRPAPDLISRIGDIERPAGAPASPE